MTPLSRPLLLAGFCILAFHAPASAHAHLKSAAPPMDGSVAVAPTELDLTFSEGVNPKFTGVKLLGSDGKALATAPASLAPGDNTTVVVPVAAPLQPGKFTVEWHALATDGHKTNGRYSFTILP